jgi:hypothetical protein
MSGKKKAAICDCGAKMKRIYMKINNKFQGVGNGCLQCNARTWDNDHMGDTWRAKQNE